MAMQIDNDVGFEPGEIDKKTKKKRLKPQS
jgi:hypothetical protein